MKCAVLFSGGKDSTYATYLARQAGHELACLITIISENPDSYMFHTPSIERTEQQAHAMRLPLIIKKTKGIKEEELKDLEDAIKEAKEKHQIKAIVSGAIASNYQRDRINKICEKLDLKSINPLWDKDELEYIKELVENKFKVIIVGVASEGLDKSWLSREIDNKFIDDVKELNKKYQIHVAGEGGEFETFVLDCPLFKKPLEVKDSKISGKDNSWRMEIHSTFK